MSTSVSTQREAHTSATPICNACLLRKFQVSSPQPQVPSLKSPPPDFALFLSLATPLSVRLPRRMLCWSVTLPAPSHLWAKVSLLPWNTVSSPPRQFSQPYPQDVLISP